MLESSAAIISLNTQLFRNCIDGISEEHLGARPAGVNGMSFIAAHVIDARTYLANLLGAALPEQFFYLEGVRTQDQAEKLPGLPDLLSSWNKVTDALTERLDRTSEEDLRKDPGSSFPIDQDGVLGAVAFLAQHESYHIGQLALLRRMHGYPAMRYPEFAG